MYWTAGKLVQVVIVPIALTSISWLLVVVGFGVGSNEDERREPGFSKSGINDRDKPESYPLWIVTFSGPFLFVSAIIHAALWKPWSSIFGAFSSFLSVLFLTGLGIILYSNGVDMRLYNEHDKILDKPPEWFYLEFAGAFMAMLLWTVVIIIWHFYDTLIPSGHRPLLES